MDVTVSVVGRDAAVEELRSLFTWLAGDEEFRGRVRLVETAPEPGTLGGRRRWWWRWVRLGGDRSGESGDCLDAASHQRGDVHGDPAGWDVGRGDS
ncbi:MAG: effector-associated constant component EACC1 [Pseudonocardiaceae bacterium]